MLKGLDPFPAWPLRFPFLIPLHIVPFSIATSPVFFNEKHEPTLPFHHKLPTKDEVPLCVSRVDALQIAALGPRSIIALRAIASSPCSLPKLLTVTIVHDLRTTRLRNTDPTHSAALNSPCDLSPFATASPLSQPVLCAAASRTIRPVISQFRGPHDWFSPSLAPILSINSA